MSVLSRRALLAVAAVVDIAINSRTGPVAAKLLAERHDLPPRHLEPVLQALVRTGILKGYRGPRGGYELGRERRRITAGDILRAARHSDDEDTHTRSPLLAHVVAPAFSCAEQAFESALDTVTIDDLCRTADTAGVVRSEEAHADFTI